jgi:hypothetical protein
MGILVENTGVEPGHLPRKHSGHTSALTLHRNSLVENTGVEPVTSSPKAFGAYKRPNPAQKFLSGEYRSRTGDLLHAMQAL